MAAIGSTVGNLVDITRGLDPAGRALNVAMLLSQKNEMINDIPWQEANGLTGHVMAQQTSLPSVSWRSYNGFVTPSKGTVAQITEGMGMLEGYSEVDVKLASLGGNVNGYRLQQEKMFAESITQEFAGTLLYGNVTTAPKEFNGLATRYNSLTGAVGDNVVSGGGSGSDNTSIWIVGWGQSSVYGLYPKGTMAGLDYQDLGVQTITNATGVGGGKMQAYVGHWSWSCGLAVQDWRNIVRICNLDVSALVADSNAADLPTLINNGIHRLNSLEGVTPRIYMNRTAFERLDYQCRQDVRLGGQLSYQVVDGKPMNIWRGFPIRISDQITETESAVA
jgi:hypothetical protein